MSSYKVRQERKALRHEVTRLKGRIFSADFVQTALRPHLETNVPLHRISFQEQIPFASLDYGRRKCAAKLTALLTTMLPMPVVTKSPCGQFYDVRMDCQVAILPWREDS